MNLTINDGKKQSLLWAMCSNAALHAESGKLAGKQEDPYAEITSFTLHIAHVGEVLVVTGWRGAVGLRGPLNGVERRGAQSRSDAADGR